MPSSHSQPPCAKGPMCSIAYSISWKGQIQKRTSVSALCQKRTLAPREPAGRNWRDWRAPPGTPIQPHTLLSSNDGEAFVSRFADLDRSREAPTKQAFRRGFPVGCKNRPFQRGSAPVLPARLRRCHIGRETGNKWSASGSFCFPSLRRHPAASSSCPPVAQLNPKTADAVTQHGSDILPLVHWLSHPSPCLPFHRQPESWARPLRRMPMP